MGKKGQSPDRREEEEWRGAGRVLTPRMAMESEKGEMHVCKMRTHSTAFWFALSNWLGNLTGDLGGSGRFSHISTLVSMQICRTNGSHPLTPIAR